MARKITDDWLRQMQADPPPKRLKVSDADTPGLQVRITPKGAVTFFCEVRVAGGKKSYRTFGQFPSLTLKGAKDMAVKTYAEARGGADSKAVAIKAARAAMPLEEVLERVHEDMAMRGKASADEQHREMRKHFKAELGHRIDEELAERMRKKIRSLATDGKNAYANHVRAWCSMTLKYAARELGAGNDWSFRLPKRFKEDARTQLLTPAECKELYGAAGALKNLHERDYVRLLILTAQRGAEIRALRRDHFLHDDKAFKLQDHETKARVAFTTPLGPTAWGIIQEAAARHNHARIICTRTGGELLNHNRLAVRVKAELGWQDKDFRMHDLRRSFATHMKTERIKKVDNRLEAISRCIAHVPPGLSQSDLVYMVDSSKAVKQRRRVFERWEEVVLGAAA